MKRLFFLASLACACVDDPPMIYEAPDPRGTDPIALDAGQGPTLVDLGPPIWMDAATQDATGGMDAGVAAADAAPNPDAGVVQDAGGPATPGWYGLGGSEFSPRSVRVLQVPDNAGISATQGWTDGTVMAFDSAGRPVVAWSDSTSGTSQIYVRRFDGTSWEELDGSATAGGVSNSSGSSSTPAIAIDGSDQIVVAWQDNTSGTSQIYLRRFDGMRWRELAGSGGGSGLSKTTSASYLASVAIGPEDEPIVAWAVSTQDGGDIYLLRYDGAQWIEVSSSASGRGVSNTDFWANTPAVAYSQQGGIVVAYAVTDDISNSEIYVRRHDGSGWQDLATTGSGLRAGDSYSNNPRVVIDASGEPIVAWEAFEWFVVDSNDIHIRRYVSGTGWQAYPGSVTNRGFYLNGTNYWAFSLALDAAGRPTVAWSDNTTGVDEIHLSRFDGNTWGELDMSASGTGVSNSDLSSHGASVAVSPQHLCVAWTESDQNHSQSVMRCHAP